MTHIKRLTSDLPAAGLSLHPQQRPVLISSWSPAPRHKRGIVCILSRRPGVQIAEFIQQKVRKCRCLSCILLVTHVGTHPDGHLTLLFVVVVVDDAVFTGRVQEEYTYTLTSCARRYWVASSQTTLSSSARQSSRWLPSPFPSCSLIPLDTTSSNDLYLTLSNWLICPINIYWCLIIKHHQMLPVLPLLGTQWDYTSWPGSVR